MVSLRIAIVLQTPKDQHSSFISLQSLARELTRQGHQVAIVTHRSSARRKTAGRLTPLIYPWIVSRWMRVHAKHCDLAVFHSYAGLARGVGRARRNVKTVSRFTASSRYHAEIIKEMQPAGGVSWRYRYCRSD